MAAKESTMQPSSLAYGFVVGGFTQELAGTTLEVTPLSPSLHRAQLAELIRAHPSRELFVGRRLKFREPAITALTVSTEVPPENDEGEVGPFVDIGLLDYETALLRTCAQPV